MQVLHIAAGLGRKRMVPHTPPALKAISSFMVLQVLLLLNYGADSSLVDSNGATMPNGLFLLH